MSFIRYLSSIGQVSGIRTLHEAVPELLAMDAETCYAGFEIRLDTHAERKAIEEVFEFLAEDADIIYLPPQAKQEDYRALMLRATDDPARERLIAHWQVLAGPDAPPFIERRAERNDSDRRVNEPERRSGARDRRAGDDARFIRVRADKLDKLIDLIGELVIASSGAHWWLQQEQSPSFIRGGHAFMIWFKRRVMAPWACAWCPLAPLPASIAWCAMSANSWARVELHITGATLSSTNPWSRPLPIP